MICWGKYFLSFVSGSRGLGYIALFIFLGGVEFCRPLGGLLQAPCHQPAADAFEFPLSGGHNDLGFGGGDLV